MVTTVDARGMPGPQPPIAALTARAATHQRRMRAERAAGRMVESVRFRFIFSGRRSRPPIMAGHYARGRQRFKHVGPVSNLAVGPVSNRSRVLVPRK